MIRGRSEIVHDIRVAERPDYNHLEFKVGRCPVIEDLYLGGEAYTALTNAGLWGVLTDPHVFGPRAKDIIAPLTMGIALLKMNSATTPVCIHELLSYCREYPNMKTSVRFLERGRDIPLSTEGIPWVYDRHSIRKVGDTNPNEDF